MAFILPRLDPNAGGYPSGKLRFRAGRCSIRTLSLAGVFAKPDVEFGESADAQNIT